MKRIISILSLLIIVILPLQVNALSVSKNNLTIEKGTKETIELYMDTTAEVSQITFSLVYTSYDVPAYFTVSSGLTDNMNGIKHQIVFSEPVSGKINLGTINIDVVQNSKITASTINVHSASALTENGEKIKLKSQIINVNIGDKNDEEINNNNVIDEDTPIDIKETRETNLLEKIESEIVNIELKKDVYEYTIYIADELESLDLKPIIKNEKYKLEITSQKIAELKDNQIIITVKNEEYTEKYKINVKKQSEQEKLEIKIDESKFEPTLSYKGKWVGIMAILFVGLLVGIFFMKKQ